MRNLFQLIIRYHFFLLFLLLEGISFLLVVRYNHFQSATFNSFATSVEGFINERLGEWKDYLNLRYVNEELRQENIMLRNRIDRLTRLSDQTRSVQTAGGPARQFNYRSARVINNSVNKQFNYITIDKGSLHGLEAEMAVISPEGVVGIVFSVSRHYSVVMPVLNLNFRLSSKLERNDYFGSLRWTGKGTGEAILSDIPYHVNISRGDTILTSGYSSIFPEGILVGMVSDYSREEGSFNIIRVRLSVDFRKLSYVTVIGNMLRDEQLELEEMIIND